MTQTIEPKPAAPIPDTPITWRCGCGQRSLATRSGARAAAIAGRS